MDTEYSEKTYHSDDEAALVVPSPATLFTDDPESIKAKGVVTDFVHLLEKSKNLFNGLKYVCNYKYWCRHLGLVTLEYIYKVCLFGAAPTRANSKQA